MTDEEKIAGAAEIILLEGKKRGHYMSVTKATELAKKLYDFWKQTLVHG